MRHITYVFSVPALTIFVVNYKHRKQTSWSKRKKYQLMQHLLKKMIKKSEKQHKFWFSLRLQYVPNTARVEALIHSRSFFNSMLSDSYDGYWIQWLFNDSNTAATTVITGQKWDIIHIMVWNQHICNKILSFIFPTKSISAVVVQPVYKNRVWIMLGKTLRT